VPAAGDGWREAVKYWLIVYARRAGELRRCEEFSGGQAALPGRFAAEREHRGDPDVEVVVLGAESLDALKVTYSRYFAAPESAAKESGR
jgi:hypothetical protein